MNTDKRYSHARNAIETGEIKEFKDIFEYIPKSVVAEDLRTSVRRFTRFIDQPHKFECEEVYEMSLLFDMPLDRFFMLIMNDLVRKRSASGNGKKNGH